MQPVQQLAANVCGLYDLCGNVWEWVNDWRSTSYYMAEGRSEPHSTVGSWRVRRGGTWSGAEANMRVSRRGMSPSGDHCPTLGFRVARTAR